jgi:hypothetical protein
MYREENIKFIRPHAIHHLIRHGTNQPDLINDVVVDVDFNVNPYYPTQRPLNRFQLPTSSMPYPFKAAYGCAMPLINKEAGY